MNIKRTFRQAAIAQAEPAAGPLRVATVRGKQVAWYKRLLKPGRQGIRHCLHERMEGTGLSVDEPADCGPRHADIGSEAGAALEAVAADVDHDCLDPIMKPGPGWRVAFRKILFLWIGRTSRFDGICRNYGMRCIRCCVESLLVGHSLRVLRRVSEVILPNINRTCNARCAAAAMPIRIAPTSPRGFKHSCLSG